MAAKGRRKLEVVIPRMAANWDAAKSRMKTNYGALPFGPKTKAKFNEGIDAARYRAPDLEKWERNWAAGVSP